MTTEDKTELVELPARIREVLKGLYDFFSNDSFMERFGFFAGFEEVCLQILLEEVREWLDSLPPSSK